MASFAIDPTWDRRMPLVGRGLVRGVVLAALALVPMAFGVPAPLWVTMPLAALVARERPRGNKRGHVMDDTSFARQGRIRSIVVGIAIVVGALGLLINSLPSQDLHDRYWYLFVAPSMIGVMVGTLVADPGGSRPSRAAQALGGISGSRPSWPRSSIWSK